MKTPSMFLRKSLLIFLLLALCTSFVRAVEGDKDNDYFTGIKEGGDLDDEADDDIEKHIEGDVSEEEEKVEEPPVERPLYTKPKVVGFAYFAEPFHNEKDLDKKWILSQARKEGAEDSIAKYDGRWSIEEPDVNPLKGDLALILKSKAKHHAISCKLQKPYDFVGKPFIIQYEVKFQNGIECGGAYVKLLSKDNLDLLHFHDKTSYTIMFGPDKCGLDYKLHFIFRHKNPKTGEITEKHAKKPTGSIESYFTDKKTHLYQLIVNPDNTFKISVDGTVVNEGNLLEDMTPPVNPAKEIEDNKDQKPGDWDDREKIADPDAVKPDDWDEEQPEKITDEDAVKPSGWLDEEPEDIPDPDAEKPADWDDDMDGEWEAPLISNPKCADAPGCGEWKPGMIDNPKYKGKWRPPMIDNPNYQGIWKPRMIPNPDYFEDLNPYQMIPIGAVGLELWSMTDSIMFDNILITDNLATTTKWTEDTFALKQAQEKSSISGKSVVQAVIDVTNERPWLWAVFIVVVLLPIVLVIAYCCVGSSAKDETAERKKTDAPSPDDKVSDDSGKAKGDSEEVKEDSEKKKEDSDKPADEGNQEEEEEEEEEEGDNASGSEEKVEPVDGRPKKPLKGDLEVEKVKNRCC
ncbi:calnexin isoform X2 [Octopus sinensis]|uniref:Calnexin isoform X2 n=1 Tax=Octopus sinensis TaxID=2607531 RepID=A0A6P7T0S5_9MOLL|nr:calnexin isoform X2 [Octopus sinensis]